MVLNGVPFFFQLPSILQEVDFTGRASNSCDFYMTDVKKWASSGIIKIFASLDGYVKLNLAKQQLLHSGGLLPHEAQAVRSLEIVAVLLVHTDDFLQGLLAVTWTALGSPPRKSPSGYHLMPSQPSSSL